MTATAPPGQPLPAARSASTTATALLHRPALLVAAVIVATTLLGAVASLLVPELGPGRQPRPTLHGTPAEAATIALHNTRSLLAPLLLCAGRWHTSRLTGPLGDLLVTAIVLSNAALVGVALGRHPATLPAYLPHMPLENTALAIAAGAWFARRLEPRTGARVAGLTRTAALVVLVTTAAAIVETYAVPHKG